MDMGRMARSAWDYKLYPILFLALYIAIVSVSNYYATNFAGYDYNSLPTDKLFYYLTTNFNVYTEAVSPNYTQNTIYQHYQWDMIGSIFTIFMAFLLLMVFSILHKHINTAGRGKDKRQRSPELANYLVVAFFIAVIVASYITVAIDYLRGVFGVGISLLLVDSSATMLIFSLLDTLFFAKLAKRAINNSHGFAKLLFLGGALACIIMLLLVVAFSLYLFTSFFFPDIAEVSIIIHLIDLISFIVIFSIAMLSRKRTQGFVRNFPGAWAAEPR
ncbi:MAG: hypothetical protein KGI00_04130 [Candidatus Micrarchaeota archaeon]|nr:hypothetical protein [Candidatus Micrarchaeota archaeon]